MRVHPAGSSRCGVRHGVIARCGSLPPHPLFDLRFDDIQTHILPAILDLDIGEGQTVLEGSGHLIARLSIPEDCHYESF